MATATLSAPEASAELTEWVPYLMTAEEYFKAVEADVFPPNRRIELWEGQIYEKMAKKLPHSGAQNLVAQALWSVLPKGWTTWTETPILLDDFTTPLPDVAVVRGTPNVYTRRGSVPKVDEIGLVIEVADSTLRKNLTKTLGVYARAGLPFYWVINLAARRVEVYSKPRVEGEMATYALIEVFDAGKDVPLVLDNQEFARIPVNDLVPEPEQKGSTP